MRTSAVCGSSPGRPLADVATNLLSLDRIAETGAQVVLPGHGEPFRSGVAAAVRETRVAGAA